MTTLAPPTTGTVKERLRQLEIGTLGRMRVFDLKDRAERIYHRTYIGVLVAATVLAIAIGGFLAAGCYRPELQLPTFWTVTLLVAGAACFVVAAFAWQGTTDGRHVADWDQVLYSYHVAAWYRRPLPPAVTALAERLIAEFGEDNVFVERTIGDPFLFVSEDHYFDVKAYVIYWRGRHVEAGQL